MSFTNKNRQKRVLGLACLSLLVAVGVFLIAPSKASAATLTVETAEDGLVFDGDCTLREAMLNVNAQANTHADCTGVGVYGTDDTIEFEITTGGTTFTNQGQTGYTITTTSVLPTIARTVTIDGYTQDGADPNDAVAPEPMNGILLIQLNGASAGPVINGFDIDGGAGGAAGTTITGLIIINFSEHGINIGANDVSILGNYIGTNYTGLSTTDGNGNAGVTNDSAEANTDDAIIGGTNPAHRNIISGNAESGGYPKDGWVLQGNYVGVGADGETPIPNSGPGGSGAFSIDECDGVIVGGTAVGAANVVSGNASHGLAPLDATNLTIQGNLIGTDWTGTQSIPNQTGIILGDDLTGSVIGGTSTAARNIISGNTLAGISSGATGGLRVEGNYVGLDITGSVPVPNGAGMVMAGDGVVIGGTSSARNVISGNTAFNVSLQGVLSPGSNGTLSGNYIGTNAAGEIDSAITAAQGEGVRISANTTGNLIGQSSSVPGTTGNRIAGNRGTGVSIRQLTIVGLGTIAPTHNAVLGNEIYGNITGGPIADAEGLGIDIYEATLDAFAGVPFDMGADSYVNLGTTLNDASDADAGPNAYMNYPVLDSATQDGTQLSVTLDLDAADSTLNNEYRVEFYANDAADGSGFGEGQTYLGATNITNGNDQTANIVLAQGTDLTGKVLSATTTALSNTTDSGFGATSEFSEVNNITVLAAATGNTNNTSPLAETGAKQYALITLAVLLVTSSTALAIRFKRLQYSSHL